ncbi:TetR family transcriptional regulator C-terminal domain-containing protein, partial [Pseudomonas aeruginosa]|uniref:TetR family transcriptional regulator C-terminal domain-containing protein n=1 Tax=Pseudomonas aeruginosa TaxID=287 RepID=UPI003CC62D65
SNQCFQFRRQHSADDARAAARGQAALIDGLWLRGAQTGDAFDTDEALNIANDYLDQQLAKQSG